MDDMAAYYPPQSGLHHDPRYPYYHLLRHRRRRRWLSNITTCPSYSTPTPPFASYVPPPYSQSSHDQVRTLFVAGLPEDVKAREIYNLFREFPGYESSHLRSPNASSLPFAFAVFTDQQSAIAAMQALNGMVFDLEKGSTLYIDLAKSNSRSKRTRFDDEKPGSEKRSKGSAAFSRGIHDPGVGNVHMPGIGNSAYNTIGYPSTQSHANFDGRAVNETSTATFQNNYSTPHVPQNVNACPTLFVANLGPTCSEQELIQVFSSCHGFIKLKMQSTYGTPVAFVDFQDAACSSEALNHLQGQFCTHRRLVRACGWSMQNHGWECVVRSRGRDSTSNASHITSWRIPGVSTRGKGTGFRLGPTPVEEEGAAADRISSYPLHTQPLLRCNKNCSPFNPATTTFIVPLQCLSCLVSSLSFHHDFITIGRRMMKVVSEGCRDGGGSKEGRV
ncbi:RNA-binding protein with multiple splicing 2 [Camellia lanceoleosa]|uniref:RNA-binding protein with multiple splicing 2 n=1 Tax=Camellia lanceoleosa TaxID=1840588 RepID=A0ACC0I1X4_9ERIC|nr:RNA-binding protein with multiple splicing 2 [Camellia lanceoleosa]